MSMLPDTKSAAFRVSALTLFVAGMFALTWWGGAWYWAGLTVMSMAKGLFAMTWAALRIEGATGVYSGWVMMGLIGAMVMVIGAVASYDLTKIHK